VGFADLLRDVASGRGLAVPQPSHPEPWAHLEYAEEIGLKRRAVESFWRTQQLPGHPEAVVAAPVPRGYRTTSKRRAALGAKGLALTFPGAAHHGLGPSPSALDLPEHVAVYAWLAERLARPGQHALAVVANYAIIRGGPGALAVILNLRMFDARVVRAAKQLAEDLQAQPLGVRAAFLYLDPTGSDYYLEARRPAGALSFKRLFGPAWLQVDIDGVRLRFPPTVFSQVNNAMLAVFTETARELLGPLDRCALLDLYCGYGLFSLTVGRTAAQVLGVDFDGPAIEAARGNATHLGLAERVRFVAGRIDGEFCRKSLRAAPAVSEAILLDPPRQGTAADLAPALAARRPHRVVHICCGIDELPREVAAWSRAGYGVRRAVPLDMFPGTAGLETLLLLTPDQARLR
jgi:tRNA/tmRNA/rRNA uracil-C5-methylase (TrmA/RlmC/RlmD family)